MQSSSPPPLTRAASCTPYPTRTHSHTNTRLRLRLEQHCCDSAEFKKGEIEVIPTPKEPHLVFLKAPDTIGAIRRLLAHPYARKCVLNVYFIQGSVLNLSELVNASGTAPASPATTSTGSSTDTAEGTQRTFRVVTFPNSLKKDILPLLPDSGFDPRNFSHELYVVRAYWRFHFGTARKSPELLAYRQETQPLPQTLLVSKAYHKIAEVFTSPKYAPFFLPAGGDGARSPPLKAVDVGASPGGWSSFLASRGCQVTAIDAGKLNLSPNIHPFHSRIRHVNKLLESAEEDLKHAGPFDLVVCDMNRRPKEAVELIAQLCSWGIVRKGARAMITFKMTVRAKRDFERLRLEAQNAMKGIFRIFRILHLFSNSPRECTCLAFYEPRERGARPQGNA